MIIYSNLMHRIINAFNKQANKGQPFQLNVASQLALQELWSYLPCESCNHIWYFCSQPPLCRVTHYKPFGKYKTSKNDTSVHFLWAIGFFESMVNNITYKVATKSFRFPCLDKLFSLNDMTKDQTKKTLFPCLKLCLHLVSCKPQKIDVSRKSSEPRKFTI